VKYLKSLAAMGLLAVAAAAQSANIEELEWTNKLKSGFQEHSAFKWSSEGKLVAKPESRFPAMKLPSGEYQRIPTYNIQAPNYGKHNLLWIDVDNDGVRELFSTDFHPDYMEARRTRDSVRGVTLYDRFYLSRFAGDMQNGIFNWRKISEQTSSVCTHASRVAPGDFNNDGYTDIAISCSGYDAPPFPGSKTVILVNEGGKSFKEIVLPKTGFWHNLATADFNNDGNLDLLMSDSNWERPELFVLLNDGYFNFKRSDEYFDMGWGQRKPYFFVSTVDFNDDGKFDVFLASDEQGHSADTLILLNDGSNRFNRSNSVVVPKERTFTIPMDIYVDKDYYYVLRVHNNNGYKGSTVQKINRKTNQFTLEFPTICTREGVPCGWHWQRRLAIEIKEDGSRWLISPDYEHRERKIKLN